MKPWVVDFDDFSESNHRLDLLWLLWKQHPGFKATLFAPVELVSPQFGRHIRNAYPWLDLVPHGRLHYTAHECEDWTYGEAEEYIDEIDTELWTRGFKAPGWLISDGMYAALDEQGWWVADQTYNDLRRPPSLRAYLLNEPRKRHHHIQNDCGNGLEECFDDLMGLDSERGFGFVKDEV